MVEVAMVAPVIFFVVFCSIEFARVLMIRQALTNAIREGCRDASLATTLDSSDSEALVRQQLAKVIANSSDSSIVKVSFDPSFTGGVDSMTKIDAAVEVNCSDVSWFPLTIFSDATVRCTAQMIRE